VARQLFDFLLTTRHVLLQASFRETVYQKLLSLHRGDPDTAQDGPWPLAFVYLTRLFPERMDLIKRMELITTKTESANVAMVIVVIEVSNVCVVPRDFSIVDQIVASRELDRV